jgi:secreted trypsin-like serine protease
MTVNTDTSTYNVVPVCVPDGRENYSDRYGYATGFGVYSTDYTKYSSVKLQVILPILNDARCVQKFSPYPIDVSTQICAGENNQNRDTCAKDTGGPLVARGLDGRWHLVGSENI